MDRASWLDDRGTLFRPLAHRNRKGKFTGNATTEISDSDSVRLPNPKIWGLRRCGAFTIDGFQDVARLDTRDLSGSGFKYVKEGCLTVFGGSYDTRAGWR